MEPAQYGSKYSNGMGGGYGVKKGGYGMGMDGDPFGGASNMGGGGAPFGGMGSKAAFSGMDDHYANQDFGAPFGGKSYSKIGGRSQNAGFGNGPVKPSYSKQSYDTENSMSTKSSGVSQQTNSNYRKAFKPNIP